MTQSQRNDQRAQKRDGNRNKFYGLRQVACEQCKVLYGRVEVDPNTCAVEQYITVSEPGATMRDDEGVLVQQVVRTAPVAFMMTTNRDAILRTEARRSI